MRTITQRGRDFIVRHEGVRLTAYRDSAGLLTIGVGHLLTRSELSSGKLRLGLDVVRWDDGITGDEAMRLLDLDLVMAEQAAGLCRGITDAQFDALVSFIFNIGVAAFEGSTLRKKLFTGEPDAVPQQMLRWDRAGGVRQASLLKRRQDEAALWTSQA